MKKMRNLLTLAAAAALTGILLTGCSTEADETTIAKAETTTQTESAADAEKASEGDVSSEVAAKAADGSALAGKKISVMTPYLTSVTTNQMTGFIKDNLEAEGAEVFVIDTANDFAELASRIEDVVSSGTDGIVLVSADPNQVANQLTEAFDADIPVFGCDSGFIEGMQVNATSDNYQMGELIVRYLFDDLMGKKGTVIALTHRPHPGVVKRCEAFDDIIKEYPDIKLITEQHVPAEQPINDAEEITANLLTANPDKDSVTAIFAAWDEPAIGAAKALAEAGRVVSADPNQVANQLTEAFDADIPVFGCDSGFIEGMQVNATSDNYQMGELIVRYLFDDLMGKKGTVIALTHRPHPGVVKRCEAFDDIIKEYPDIKLITEQHVPAEQPINDAEEITANLLTANPDKDSVTAIFAAWDEPAIGAAKALAEAGRDEVIVTGVDGNEQAVQMIKDGSCLKATVKQNFEGMAEIVCQQMKKYYAGETIEKGEMYAPAELITQENAQ